MQYSLLSWHQRVHKFKSTSPFGSFHNFKWKQIKKKIRKKNLKKILEKKPGSKRKYPWTEKSSLINWFFWKVLIQEYGTRVNNDVIHLRWILNLNRPCIVIRLLFSGVRYVSTYFVVYVMCFRTRRLWTIIKGALSNTAQMVFGRTRFSLFLQFEAKRFLILKFYPISMPCYTILYLHEKPFVTGNEPFISWTVYLL